MAASITDVKKRRLGAQDISFDYDGTGAIDSVPRSDGKARQVSRVNAKHIPSLIQVRDKIRIGTAAAKSNGLNVHEVLLQIFDDLLLIGQPDDVTVEESAGELRIKDDGVTAAKLKSDMANDAVRAVTTDHIRDLAVTTAKIADLAVTAAKLESDASSDANRAVSTNHIKDLAITLAKMAVNSVDNDKVVDKTIAAGKLNMDGNAVSESTPVVYPVKVGKHHITTNTTTAALAIDGAQLEGVVDDYYVIATPDNSFNGILMGAKMTLINQISYKFNVASGSGFITYLIFKQTV